MKKTKAFKDVENRNEQFENIDSLKEKYVKDGNPVISMEALFLKKNVWLKKADNY